MESDFDVTVPLSLLLVKFKIKIKISNIIEHFTCVKHFSENVGILTLLYLCKLYSYLHRFQNM